MVHKAAGTPAEQLAGDVVCRRCSYNLRGLAPQGTCPECGNPIAPSMDGELLRNADPRWVGTLSRGAALIMWGLILSLVAYTVGDLSTFSYSAFVITRQIPMVLASLLVLPGAWLLTVRDPGKPAAKKLITAQRIIRIFVVLALLDEIEGVVLFSIQSPLAGHWVVNSVAVVQRLMETAGHFALFLYMGILAGRIPHRALVKEAKFLKWFVLLLGGLYTLRELVIALSLFYPGLLNNERVFSWVFLPAYLVFLPYAAVAIHFFWRFKRETRAQAELATEIWQDMPRRQPGSAEKG